MDNKLKSVYNGLNVLVTGHNGFKGSWLCIWLKEMGANVIGYSVGPPTNPNNFEVCKIKEKIINVDGDIRDIKKLNDIFERYKPQIVFHLAAQAIVLKSFDNPLETFESNVLGTINVLESIRKSPYVKAAVIVTSDKCYENLEKSEGYVETDRLGGHDPYSTSKGMAELAVSSYLKCFFANSNKNIASARAGNVIGGGDFGEFRLIPDCMKALMKNEKIILRNPSHVRPWQYVLEPLSGYLLVGAKLLNEGKKISGAWNFGPRRNSHVTTKTIIEKIINYWGSGEFSIEQLHNDKKETSLLVLNWDKAKNLLLWGPVLNWEVAVGKTVEWFKEYSKKSGEMYDFSVRQINEYVDSAKNLGIEWAV